jgi:DNA polymerase III subunit delta'
MPKERTEETASPPPPRANPLLFGHEHAEKQLAGWIEEGRLGQALLICGPWGIGKATWAYRIARRLLREGVVAGQGGGQGDLAGQGFLLAPPPAAKPVDEAETADQTFRWVAASAHPDLLTVERRYDEKRGRQLGEIVVDDVRLIGTFLASSPAHGGWRVVIVDAADEMNRNAANALLKVLEEPGRNSLLLLV